MSELLSGSVREGIRHMDYRLAVIGALLLAASVAAQEPAAAGPGDAELILSLQQAMELAVQNNLSLRTAILNEHIERQSVREALAAFDPSFFAQVDRTRRASLFRGEFPGPPDPVTGLPTTVAQTISLVSDVQDYVFGLRGALETGLSYDLTFSSNVTDVRRAETFDPAYNTGATLSISQPILRAAWASYNEAPIELARIGRMESLETYRIAKRDKLGEVQQAYYDLVFAIADIENKERSLKLADDQILITRQRVASGALAEIEVTSAQSARAARFSDLVSSRASKREAEDQLRRLILAFDHDADWEVVIQPTEVIHIPDTPTAAQEEPILTLLPVDQIVRLAERSHPELLRAHMALARTEIGVVQAESESLPVLDVNASATFRGLSDEDILSTYWDSFSPDEGALNWQLGLAFEYPLGNRAAAARVRKAVIERRKARLSLHDVRTDMVFHIRSALRDVNVAREEMGASDRARVLAREQLDNERLRLELRQSTNFQVFQVEDELNLRRTDLLQARISYRLALLSLARAAGVPLMELLAK